MDPVEPVEAGMSTLAEHIAFLREAERIEGRAGLSFQSFAFSMANAHLDELEALILTTPSPTNPVDAVGAEGVRDTLCRIIESNPKIYYDGFTGLPLGSHVEALADRILAALRAQPVEHEGLAELVDHFPTGLRSKSGHLPQTGEVFEGPIQCECHCGASFAATDEQEVRQLWADHVAALSRQPVEAEGWRALDALLRYHESGGHEGDGSDEALAAARRELVALTTAQAGSEDARR